MIEAAALIVFPALMVFSAFSDLFTMTISQSGVAGAHRRLCGARPLPSIPLRTFGLHVSCGLAMLALTFAMFQLGWVGGGDAKLASASALWLGWENLLDYEVVASIGGGVLTVAIIALRWNDMPGRLLSIPFMARLAEKDAGVPYGIALALAGLLLYPHSGIWNQLSAV